MKLVSINKAATELGVCKATLREWQRNGLIVPTLVLPSGHRRYDLDEIKQQLKAKGNKWQR